MSACAAVPVERVARDYFGGVDRDAFLRKIGKGEIRQPVMRIGQSPKGAYGVHVKDLARSIGERREAALKEMRPFHS